VAPGWQTMATASPEGALPAHGGSVARPFALRDVTAFRRLASQGVFFDLRQSLLHGSSPLASALLGLVTHQHWGAITCVHEPPLERSNGQPRRAFCQVLPRPDGVSWDLSFLYPALDQASWASRSWLDQLQYMMVLGGQRQVERLCARAPEDGGIEETLRSAGLCVVGREEVFYLDQSAKHAPQPKGLLRMTWEHRQAVRALRLAVQPRLRRQAERMLPCDEVAYPQPPGTATRDEYVWQIDDQVMAYLALSQTRRASWLDAVVRPEVRAEMAPHLRYLVGLAEPNRQRPLYCAVPDHSIGLGWVLRTLSFKAYSRQSLLVGFPLARVGVRRPMVIPGLEGSVDIGTPVQGISRPGVDPNGGSCH